MEKGRLPEEMAGLLARVRDSRPLVHCITNYVAANDSANILLAIGASPIMADCSAEAAEIAAQADGILLNLGIPNPDKARAMRFAGETANRLHKPLVFDPVGAGASAFRKETSAALLKAVRVQIIRGNAGEMRALCGMQTTSEGVDAVKPDSCAEALAKTVAEEYGCIAAITGETDVITDGERTVRLLNGHPMLSSLTGSGCMASAITAAFAAVSDDPLVAACAGVSFMGICGELAAAYSTLAGGFHTALFDAAGAMTAECFLDRLRLMNGSD